MKSILSALATALLLSFSGAGMAAPDAATAATLPDCSRLAPSLRTKCTAENAARVACMNVRPSAKKIACEKEKLSSR